MCNYASEIWGYRGYEQIDQVQNRAIRAYLGIHGFGPNLSIQGVMGWTDGSIRRRVNMVRYWNRLVRLNDDRLTKKGFLWGLRQTTKGWASEMREIFDKVGMLEIYNLLTE